MEVVKDTNLVEPFLLFDSHLINIKQIERTKCLCVLPLKHLFIKFVNFQLEFQRTKMPIKLQLNSGTPQPSSSMKINLGGPSRQHVPAQPTGPVTFHDADMYQEMELRDQIYKVPDTYIGSCQHVARTERLLKMTDETVYFQQDTIMLPDGVEQLFKEILTNSSDNVSRSRAQGVDPGEITITMDSHIVTVRNGGILIPIGINTLSGKYAADLIFGNLLTSSNYDEENRGDTAGRNGYGAKLTNIFSNNFVVIIADPSTGRMYRQEWSNNMRIRNEPVITTDYRGDAYVEVQYRMDFERFGYPEGGYYAPDGVTVLQGYPPEAFELFAAHAADVAFTRKVPVIFNGRQLNCHNVETYAKWIGPEWDNIIVHRQYPEGTPLKSNGNPVDPSALPVIEMCIADTPDNGGMFAFTNGLYNKDGGYHVDTALKSVGNPIIKLINETKDAKTKKNNSNVKLTLKDIKDHLTVVISVFVPNAKFDSQVKAKLKSFNGYRSWTIDVPESKLKKVTKWDFTDRMLAAFRAKCWRSANKGRTKKRKPHVNLEAAKDANEAGREGSMDCWAYITEGKSAQGYVTMMISQYPGNGRDYHGSFPLKGKPLNVLNHGALKIANNQELRGLEIFLGLHKELGQLKNDGSDYRSNTHFSKLRYGKLVIVADADPDGKHIAGLVIVFLYKFYPSLLLRGDFLYFMRTPLIRIRLSQGTVNFYTRPEHERWTLANPGLANKDNTEYFKGLGSSSREDIAMDVQNMVVVRLVMDINAENYIKLAFKKEFADHRKTWLKTFQYDPNAEQRIQENISTFINYEVVEHSFDNVKRSLPGKWDGQKESQRKIIDAFFKRWGKKIGKKGREGPKKAKTANLANYVSENTGYHHGEKSLIDTIGRMTLRYTGANNLPVLAEAAQFGTRDEDGDDGADGRYTATYPEWWWRLVFHDDDMDILTSIIDEGIEYEPETYYPIFPLAVVNGAYGIGTGWSTFMPKHNPVDVCYWLISKAKGEIPRTFLPWYRGFKGTIEVKSVKPRKAKETEDFTFDAFEIEELEENDMDQDEIAMDNAKYSMVTTGVFMPHASGDCIEISELPIGRSIHWYRVWLNKQLDEGEITDYRDLSKDDSPRFLIYGYKGKPTAKKLKLVRTFGMSNMWLIDTNNRPHKFNTIHDYMESFYQERLPIYGKRKAKMVEKLNDQINKTNLKIRFIDAVLAGDEHGKIDGQTIVLFRQKKAEIYRQMEMMNLPRELLTKTNASNFSEEDIEALRSKIEQWQAEIAQIESISNEEMWIADLEKFLVEYEKVYGHEAMARSAGLKINVNTSIGKSLVKPRFDKAGPSNAPTTEQAVTNTITLASPGSSPTPVTTTTPGSSPSIKLNIRS